MKRVAAPEEDLVRLYLDDVGRHGLLTKDDEIRLGRAVEAGRHARAELAADADADDRMSLSRQRRLRRVVREGEEATEAFVTANLRLVVAIAKRYQAGELPLLDLVQEGNLGLIHAVEKFDWRKGFKFSTYATWWIRQAITRGIANGGRTVRLPIHAGDLLHRVLKARVRLEGRLGRRPTVAELAADLDLAETKVTEILRYASEPVSLSAPLRSDDDAELGDFVEDHQVISPFDAAASSLLAGDVAKILLVLDPRERRVVQLRFGLDRGEPRTLEEVGAQLELTRERIRQIEAGAMSKLREPALARGARDLLGG